MKKSSFIEGTVIATAAIVITKILGMLYVIPFYQLIGLQGSALYAYAYNIYVIFLDISSAGLPIAISKIIKEYNTLNLKEAKVRAYKLGQKMIFSISVIVFIILFIFAQPIGQLIIGDLQGGNTIYDVGYVIRAVSFAILVVPFLSVSKGYLQGHNIINVSSISQVIEQVVRITVILLGSYLALKVFHLSLRTSVGIAVFGAFVGGLSAILYIMHVMRTHRQELDFVKHPKNSVSNQEIIKKIISYAIPFIIIDIAVSLYNFIDMVFISRTMVYLGYNAATTEFVTSSVATWAGKIGMIVNSIAMGLTVSLIPSIVEAFTLKKWSVVGQRLNKALQIILITCIPMVVGLSLLAAPVWSIFYGENALGAEIFQYQILISLFFNLYTITSSTLQSVNKFKYVYLTTLSGYLTNAILDVPLMLLFHALGLQPFMGAQLATVCGYTISIILALLVLKKQHNLKYLDTLKLLKDLIFPTLAMILIVLLLKLIIPLNLASKLSCILFVAITSISGAIVYLTILFKNGLLEKVFGKAYLNKIIKKLTFSKVSL